MITADTITADTITAEMIRAIRDAACECRPYLPIESDEHATSHDCDVPIYDDCVTALESPYAEEEGAARSKCAEVANDVIANHGSGSQYWRRLMPIVKRST